MYVITGATGNIGKRVAELLLSQGKKVRVVGRNQDRLAFLAKKGAEPFVGSVEDSSTMIKAYQGSTAVFNMIPPDLQAPNVRAFQNKVGEVLASAISAAKVKYVVNLSSVGAHLSEKVGPVNGLFDNEQRLNKLKDTNIVHVRPSFFMENLLWNVDLIKNMGICGSPIRSDIKFPMIATRDIADVVARLLTSHSFTGKSTKELLGQRDVSMGEATKIIGKAIGKPELQYIQFPYEGAEKSMIGMGLSADMARNFIELYRSLNEGVFVPTEKRTTANTTQTSIEEFSNVFAVIYLGGHLPKPA